jgi:hypothetical protein
VSEFESPSVAEDVKSIATVVLATVSALSVSVRDWDTDSPAALVAVKVNVHCRSDVVDGTGDP